MHNLIKINKENYPDMYEKNIDKYVFLDQNQNIIGISTINDGLKYNKIQIKILDKYRSNGYGKILFKKTLEEYKNHYSNSELIFKMHNQNLFNNILYSLGAISVDNTDGVLEFVLPIE